MIQMNSSQTRTKLGRCTQRQALIDSISKYTHMKVNLCMLIPEHLFYCSLCVAVHSCSSCAMVGRWPTFLGGTVRRCEGPGSVWTLWLEGYPAKSIVESHVLGGHCTTLIEAFHKALQETYRK